MTAEFNEGPDCDFSGMCFRSCLAADTINQAIEDDIKATEKGKLPGILGRIRCQNPQAQQARDKAQQYLEPK